MLHGKVIILGLYYSKEYVYGVVYFCCGGGRVTEVCPLQVCLSILNTWHGRPEEKWNPQTSSFLQVRRRHCRALIGPSLHHPKDGGEDWSS
jgi:hypothetical protein